MNIDNLNFDEVITKKSKSGKLKKFTDSRKSEMVLKVGEKMEMAGETQDIPPLQTLKGCFSDIGPSPTIKVTKREIEAPKPKESTVNR